MTGGEDGLLNIPRPPLDLGFVQVSLSSHAALFYFALVLFAVIAWVLWYLIDTPFGRVLGAVKQNEMRAAYCGHNVWLVKFTVFVCRVRSRDLREDYLHWRSSLLIRT